MCSGCECCNTLPDEKPGSISLKFNGGNPALLYQGAGMKLISALGLHTSHELANAHQARKDAEAERDAERAAHRVTSTTLEASRMLLEAETTAHHAAAGRMERLTKEVRNAVAAFGCKMPSTL